MATDGVRRGLHQFRHKPVVLLGVASAPAIIDAEVAAIFPAQFAQLFEEGSDARLTRLISRSVRAKQDADTPRTLNLLRARGERPCRSRTTENTQKFPSPHANPP